jgi:photosystem II stability/assembly factor-like uncharacterized protein
MKKLVAILLTILMLFTLFQGALRVDVAKASCGWQEMNVNFANVPNECPYSEIHVLAIDPNNTNTMHIGVWGGFYKSVDGGQNWKSMNKGGLPSCGQTEITSIVIDPKNSNIIYIGTQGFPGIYKSTDGGENWIKLNIGIDLWSPVAVDPSNTNTIYAGSKDGVCKSTDGGQSWKVMNKGFGVGGSLLCSIAIDPRDTNIIYATGWSKVGSDRALYKSIDGGQSWNMIFGPPFYDSVWHFAIDPVNTNIVYVIATGKLIYKSTDGGNHWDEGNFLEIQPKSIYIDPINTNIIYAMSDYTIYKSVDAGKNWNEMNTGLTLGDKNKLSYLCIDPTNTNTIYAVSWSKVFKYRYDLFVITTISEPFYGQVSPSGTVAINSGANQTFTITPNPGYHIKDVKVDGKSVGAVSSYTFTNINSDHTIEVTFEKN